MKSEKTSVEIDIPQGTQEWLNLRKTKITATDACIIMGASHWKTKSQLYYEKISNDPPPPQNERMQRGTDLEPIARDLFTIQTGISVAAKVFVKDWAMASLDGINEEEGCVLEIKCPGEKVHAMALAGKIPEYYYPQIQHQLYVTGLDLAYYFSFYGIDGVYIKVPRDDDYISKMVEEELKFYDCLINRIPPESSKTEYIERNDGSWALCASRWIQVSKSLKNLQQEEEDLRKQLIFLSEGNNTKGNGVYLSQIQRKGVIDYNKIPELKDVDLDKYRKEGVCTWRITS
jgi:putative phage-type endonuclease